MKTRIKRNELRRCFMVVLAALLFIGCSAEDVEKETPDPDNNGSTNTGNTPGLEGMLVSTAIIDASGGEVALSSPKGSISLTIPPGALSSATEITVYTPEENPEDDLRIAFEPDGLTFKKPARLKISLSQDLATTYGLSSMWHISELNDLVDAGSERHRWKRMANIEIDPSGAYMSGEMEHFSTAFVLLGIQREAYLVIDLPGKYLRPGDGVFVMSGNSNYEYNWVPGHVGIVNTVNPNDGTPDGSLMVLESTLGGGPLDNIDGVQTNPLQKFRRTSQHLYMGARRPTPPNVDLTDGERRGIIAKGISQLGLGYDYLGGALANKWSCSELVEATWDAVFRGVFKAGTDFFPTPVEMFEKTTRVSEIDVKVGEEVVIPVYPVEMDKSANIKLGTGFYIAGNPGVNAAMTIAGQAPQGSTWTVDNTHVYKASKFRWTPTPMDAGTTVRVVFNMVGSVTLNNGQVIPYNIYKHLDMHVGGEYTTINVTPVQMGQTGVFYDHYFAVPQGAIIGPNSSTHLIDTATGNYPVNPIFRDQVLDSFQEGWLDPARKTHYGMTLHISRLDDPFSSPPTGSHVWGYYIDYEMPRYNGY